MATPFQGEINAVCWQRELVGDFAEIVDKIELTENFKAVDKVELKGLVLSEEGQLARNTLLNDFELLKSQGADPVLNVIKCYERDDVFPFFPTDVYSYHVDRSPIPVDTILCTYCGEASEIIPNEEVVQKVLVPEIREELIKVYNGPEEDFEAFLSEYFFDLHYQSLQDSPPVNLGRGHLWRLACDYPNSSVPPCVHRAPIEKDGKSRLLLIC